MATRFVRFALVWPLAIALFAVLFMHHDQAFTIAFFIVVAFIALVIPYLAWRGKGAAVWGSLAGWTATILIVCLYAGDGISPIVPTETAVLTIVLVLIYYTFSFTRGGGNW